MESINLSSLDYNFEKIKDILNDSYCESFDFVNSFLKGYHGVRESNISIQKPIGMGIINFLQNMEDIEKEKKIRNEEQIKEVDDYLKSYNI